MWEEILKELRVLPVAEKEELGMEVSIVLCK
jgi:hypothetical protein